MFRNRGTQYGQSSARVLIQRSSSYFLCELCVLFERSTGMAQSNGGTVTLMSGGDIGPVYEPTEEFAELIAPALRQADLRLGQCKRVYSERGWMPQFALGPGGQHTRLHPRMA